MTKFDKKLFTELGKAVVSAAVAFILLLLACVMCGCKTKYVPMHEYHTETIRSDTAVFNAILKAFRESVRNNQRSSDSVKHLLKETTTLTENGDTARHDRIEYIYLSSYKEKEYERIIEEQNDSIEKLNTRLESVRTDSIPVPYPVEKQLTKWESTKMSIGGITMTVLIASAVSAILAWIVRRFRK